MRLKCISLCLNSFEIASKMPNFSAWVREKIFEEGDLVQEPLLTLIFTYKCPRCRKCRDFPNQKMAWRCNMCDVALDFVSVVV